MWDPDLQHFPWRPLLLLSGSLLLSAVNLPSSSFLLLPLGFVTARERQLVGWGCGAPWILAMPYLPTERYRPVQSLLPLESVQWTERQDLPRCWYLESWTHTIHETCCSLSERGFSQVFDPDGADAPYGTPMCEVTAAPDLGFAVEQTGADRLLSGLRRAK